MSRKFLAVFILAASACFMAFFNPGKQAKSVQAPPPQSLQDPCLPDVPYEYANLNLPEHYKRPSPPWGNVAVTDNTPADNPVTNEGATLGRVLFYDVRLSAANNISCASCHRQETGFSDPRQFSVGFEGGLTHRHSMSLINARYYRNGKFFWDERAETLEEQVLEPIQDPIEMGMTLDAVIEKLEQTTFYPDLFRKAFGSEEITEDKIAKALAQFVRSIVSFNSKFDEAFKNPVNGQPDFEGTFSRMEYQGFELFQSENPFIPVQMRCNQCHTSVGMVGIAAMNNGLDSVVTDPGAENGAFKTPSLRNVALRKHFMHDGRFSSLEEVIDFYSEGIQDNPHLHPQLRELKDSTSSPLRFNLTRIQKDALIAFLHTLTDTTISTDPKYSNPFCDEVYVGQDEIPSANPVRLFQQGNMLTLQASENWQNAGVDIFDLSGKRVFTGQLRGLQLSTPTHLSSKVYLVRVSNNLLGKVHTQKIVLSR